MAIIQARMGSQRLPGKVMLELCSKPVLWHVIERVKQAGLISDTAVATSVEKNDDIICGYLDAAGVKYFRGSEKDVLSRFYNAALFFKADNIVRITADCPLIDPNVIDRVVRAFLHGGVEYASNTGDERTYPRGLDCEVFSSRLLKSAFEKSKFGYEREHVTPFMYMEQDSVMFVKNDKDYGGMRWTLDTKEDFELIKKIYSHFYKGAHNFYMEDICSYLKSNPEICSLNQGVKQKGLDAGEE